VRPQVGAGEADELDGRRRILAGCDLGLGQETREEFLDLLAALELDSKCVDPVGVIGVNGRNLFGVAVAKALVNFHNHGADGGVVSGVEDGA
jgi:hypothetical protein